MKKAIKKTLFALLVCIILLAGAAFVSSATEVNTEPVVADLSEKTGTRQYAFNPEANNRINYVVTGSNPDAEIYVWGSCNITLRNASFRRLHIDYEDSYTVNITLEGENTINQYNWASQGALEIYSSQVTINGGENDSLYASSRAFTVYSNSDALGCLTVNGGNITFKSVENGNPFQTQYIQNGGNVTVIEEYGSSFLYNVQLNGGSLEVINNRASNGIVFSQYLRIKKGADLKISIPNTPYIAYDNIKLAESSDANDCIFVRFDESSDYIYLNDDNRELNGKNYMEIKVVEHIHACENGVCSCGFVCKHNTDNGTCGICGKYIYKIIHHPTEKEPFVALNDGTGASYQWYEVKGISEITDKSKTYPWSYFGAPFETESTYSEANGWTPIVYSEEGYESEYAYLYYFITRYSEGDKVTLSFSSPVIYADLFTIDGESAECEIDGTTATAVIPENGVYGICAGTENTAPTVKVYTGDAQYAAITGETAATLKKYSYGNYYFCQARANDGTVHESRLADFSYKITHQPTDREQYVSLNSSDGAAYQWYIEKGGIVSVNDENSYPFTIMGAPEEIGGTYDGENGWTPDEDGYYFVVKLEEGDILNLEFSQTPEGVLYLYSSEEGTVEDEADITAAGSIIAESDGYYGICAADGGTLKATVNGSEYIAVNGQTEATLNADKLGNYLCEVTFKDGKKERSEAVSVQHLHTGGTANCKDKAICTSCGLAYGKINADKHKSLVILDAVASTCTKTGTTEGKKCTACGKVTVAQQTVAKKAHTLTTLDAVAATCTKEGKTEGKKCTACGAVTVAQKTVAKKAHSYKNVTTKATLSKNGKVENKCSVCGYVSKTTTVYYPKTIKLSATSYTYNGKTKKPSVTVKDSKGNTLKKDTDYTVKYESGRKSPGRYTVTVTFKGKYTGAKKLYFTIAPKATSKITATQTTTTVTLKWNKVTGADGYRVYKYNSKTKKYEKLKDVTKTTLKISKLKAGTIYKYKVRAYTKDDGTIWGDYSKVFETATKCKTPKITKLTTTKGKATVKWSNVSGESGYQVYYSTKKDSGYKKVKSYKVNVVKGSKKKLKSGKKYYFKVRAYKKTASGTVYSAWSAVKSVKIK